MKVGIVKIEAGVTSLEEFRVAVDEATAIADFCNEYSPALTESDYLGINGDSLDLQKNWSWDFSASPPAIIEMAEEFEYEIQYDVNEHILEKGSLDINYKSELKSGIGYTPVFIIHDEGVLAGLIDKTEYYRDYIDENNKGTLVLVVEETYVVDETDITLNNSGNPVTSRNKKWKHKKRKDGQFDEVNVKTKPKLYNTREKRSKEGKRRRKNIVDQLIDNVGLAGVISGIFTSESDAHEKLTQLVKEHSAAFGAWKESSRGSIYDDIAAETTPWMLGVVSNTANQPEPYKTVAPIALTSVSHMQDLILKDYISNKLKGSVK